MSHKEKDKKAKKKALLKRNRHLQELFHVMKLQQGEAERIKDEEDKRERRIKKQRDSDKEATEAWGDKVASIRNRLTDQRRTSTERWNRFSGTGGEGGRGL